MISRLQRIPTQLFKEIVKKTGFSHGNLFVIRSLKCQGISRFAVSVPKKIAHTAVLRNKIKRRVYSVIKELKPRLVNNFLIIIIMKEGSEKASFDEISKEIEKNFVKYGFLK